MRPEKAAPSFDELLEFVARRWPTSLSSLTTPERVLAAAREARRELRASDSVDPPVPDFGRLDGVCEVLELFAASSPDAARPSELVSARGFRVRLDYLEGTETTPSSMCVLVQCPDQWAACVQGLIAYLWNGTQRFALGEFDADGKAIGTLPAGIGLTAIDLETGRIKLETSDVPSRD